MKYRGVIALYDTKANHGHREQEHKKILDRFGRRYDRYNRSLVDRIEDLLDPSFLMDWKLLLADNNRGKRGHPYRTPNAFITFLAKLRAVYNVPFRSLEGIARIFARITGIATVCYTSIFRRIRKIVPAIPDSQGKPVGCAAVML